jgi:hypothetical protein
MGGTFGFKLKADWQSWERLKECLPERRGRLDAHDTVGWWRYRPPAAMAALVLAAAAASASAVRGLSMVDARARLPASSAAAATRAAASLCMSS